MLIDIDQQTKNFEPPNPYGLYHYCLLNDNYLHFQPIKTTQNWLFPIVIDKNIILLYNKLYSKG